MASARGASAAWLIPSRGFRFSLRPGSCRHVSARWQVLFMGRPLHRRSGGGPVEPHWGSEDGATFSPHARGGSWSLASISKYFRKYPESFGKFQLSPWVSEYFRIFQKVSPQGISHRG